MADKRDTKERASTQNAILGRKEAFVLEEEE